MTDAALPSAARRAPPAPPRRGLAETVRRLFFASFHSTVLTILLAVAAVLLVPDILRWALVDAVWYSPGAEGCRAEGAGACWAIVAEKYRLILFGTYPYEEHWRAALASALVVGMIVLSGVRSLWSRAFLLAWVAVAAAALVLLNGGVLGLTEVGTHAWGGLPLTLVLFVGTVVTGLPIAILLALGRTSNLPGIRAVCAGVIEIVRGVPLIAILFIASLVLPLFLPEGVTIDKLIRAWLGMTIFFGAYAAEVVRGGLQAIPRGQYEAAEGMGLSYWQMQRRIVLPQALRIVIPALVNDIVRAFKNTTFVSIVGLFDILGTTRAAIEDPVWVRYAVEAYLFVFFLYFVACYAMSKYSEGVERRLSTDRNS
jgi:general L-amino acid transport system permease protein